MIKQSFSPVLLIDLSYLIFYRYYAIITWFKNSHREETFPKDYQWYQNTEFMEKFDKLFLKRVHEIAKQYNISHQQYYFVQDCPSDTIWRKAFFPDYKEQRKVFYKSSSWQGGPVFKHVYQTLLPKLIQELKCHHYRIPKLEADDIIYLLREKFAAEFTRLNPSGPETSAKSTAQNPQWRYVIITNDHDYLQLLDPHTELINLQKKLLRTKSCGDPLIDLEKKIIGGDSSDNIPKCFPRCGKKTLDKLARDPKLLEQWFLKKPGSRDSYQRNRRLIDFREIPEKYRSLL